MANKRYISGIKINQLYHLNNLQIEIADENSPCLILTGKNGSGKTVLLNAVADFLDKIRSDTHLNFLQYRKWLSNYENKLEELPKDSPEYSVTQTRITECQQRCDELFGKVELEFGNGYNFINEYQDGNFIIAMYQAARNTNIAVPKSPTKPELNVKDNIRKNLTGELIKYLSDLKMQEVFARQEGKIEDADNIRGWFDNFKGILRTIFGDNSLELEFDYKAYNFSIITKGKSFKFTEMSDGFVAILEIVADLILKMQGGGTLLSEFAKPGIVLIDEVETHLHLQLQKSILPMLTTIFPNIQFIVTTHSPFVLNSLVEATAYDLENQKPITNLTQYSYQALTEGYFGVDTELDYTRQRYDQLKELLEKEVLTAAEKSYVIQIVEDFNKIPEAISPKWVGAFRQLLISNYDRLSSIDAL